jgi:hypothetical protein
MKKAKKKSPAEGEISYQKPALRSEAFSRALSEAKLHVIGSGVVADKTRQTLDDFMNWETNGVSDLG